MPSTLNLDENTKLKNTCYFMILAFKINFINNLHYMIS